MKSRNPALRKGAFERFEEEGFAGSEVMTVQGTITKVLILGVLVFAAAGWVWNLLISTRNTAAVMPYLWGGLIAGLLIAIVTCIKPEWSPITAPIYAICEGLSLGAISSLMEMIFPGIVLQSVGLTFGVLFVMCMLYKFRVIEVTPRFQRMMMTALIAVLLLYLTTFLLGAFGIRVLYLHNMGWLGIVISLVIVGIASFSLLLDFDFIEESAAMGAPKYMEWYGAFGMLVTLVWLYLEILRLAAILSSD